MINEIEQEALNVQDLEFKIKAINIASIKKIIDPEIQTPWKSYIQKHIQQPIVKLYFQLNIGCTTSFCV